MRFSDAQIKALDAKLNGKHVRTRSDGDRSLSCIEGWHVIAEANRVFGYDGWDRETVEATRVWQENSVGMVCCSYVARVRIRVRAGENIVVREGKGAGHGSALQAGEAHEQALKEAETDAAKRALSTFGNVFGLALYDRERKGVRQERRKQDSPQPRTHKGTLVLALSATDLEVFERPEGFCSAVRKVLELTKSANSLMEFWRANQETIIGLREHYPKLKNAKGNHYVQLLGELYTRRLQEFAERARPTDNVPTTPESAETGSAGTAVVPTPRRLRERDHLNHVAGHPCLVCGRSPTQAHHLRFTQPRALSWKVSDEYTVPLCALHHREVHEAGNEQSWWHRRKIDPVPVAQELWEESRGRGREDTTRQSAAG